MRTRTGIIAALFLSLMLFGTAAAADEVSTDLGGMTLGLVLKGVYTYRDANDKSGVAGISEAGLRWVELDFAGRLGGDVSYRIDLAASSAIHRDPVSGFGIDAAAGGPGETGAIGVRQARIELGGLIPRTKIMVGTFIPDWGIYQERPSWDWRFVDLPLFYTSPAFHRIGWQNTGVDVMVKPIEQIEIELFWINGYFPGGLANSEAPLPSGGFDREKALGGRLRLILGPFSIFGGYYQEGFQEDLGQGPGTEQQRATAWLAGAEFNNDRVWALFEWTDVMVEDYQLMKNGGFTDLRGLAGHADLGIRLLDDWQVLLRWEWIDPNTADSAKTFNPSRFDQAAQYTAGVNYRMGPDALFMVNYVVPIEEGDSVDIEAGKTGGKFQKVENNYFRIQVQVRQ